MNTTNPINIDDPLHDNIDNNIDDLLSCLYNCKKPLPVCSNDCDKQYNNNETDYPNYIRCKQSCIDNKTICTDSCKASGIWNNKNPFINCSQNCWYGLSYDNKCIIHGEKDIVECCKRTCLPSEDVNCDSLCNNMLSLTKNNENISINDLKLSPLKTEKHIHYFIIISCIVVIFIITYKILKYKFKPRK